MRGYAWNSGRSLQLSYPKSAGLTCAEDPLCTRPRHRKKRAKRSHEKPCLLQAPEAHHLLVIEAPFRSTMSTEGFTISRALHFRSQQLSPPTQPITLCAPRTRMRTARVRLSARASWQPFNHMQLHLGQPVDLTAPVSRSIPKHAASGHGKAEPVPLWLWQSIERLCSEPFSPLTFYMRNLWIFIATSTRAIEFYRVKP